MTIYLMQGAPGSGKSTWIERNAPEACVVSADHYFYRPNWYSPNREYHFDPSKLGVAHASCMRKFIRAIELDGETLIVVDNTSPRVSDLSPYYAVAKALSEEPIVVVRVLCDPAVAAARNVHGVPAHAVERITAAMENPPPFWDCQLEVVNNNPASRKAARIY
jgi:hypothetical protein